MKEMFFKSGFPNGYDGRCSDCPFWIMENGGGGCRCTETNQDVRSYVLNGRINKKCPFIQKEV